MNRIPPNGTRVRMGERCGRVSRTGHPPAGVIVEIEWDDDHSLAWYPASEVDYAD